MPTRAAEATSFASGGIFFHGVHAEPAAIAGVRDALRQWLGTVRIDADQASGILLASYEALANSVEHAYSAGAREATVDFTATYRPRDLCLEVTVTDHGRWREAPDTDALGSRGHGLALIRRLASEAVVTTRPDGTDVAMRWLLAADDR